MNNNPEHSSELMGATLLAASSTLRCTTCGVEEFVVPLDDQPIDEMFAANYLCDECEDLALLAPALDNAR